MGEFVFHRLNKLHEALRPTRVASCSLGLSPGMVDSDLCAIAPKPLGDLFVRGRQGVRRICRNAIRRVLEHIASRSCSNMGHMRLNADS